MVKSFILFFTIVALALAGGNADAFADSAALSEAVSWLENESHRLIRTSRRTMKDGTSAFPPQVGIGYEAFWLRDYVYTLDLVDSTLADRTVIEMVSDFKKGGTCEWILGEKRRLPNYLASALLPLAGIRAMIERRGN